MDPASYFSFFLLCFTSFFTLINPLGVVPVYLTMTNGIQAPARRATARKATITAAIALLAFAFTGQALFNFFGISVNGLKVVGGFIFFLMGQDMLQARLTATTTRPEDVKSYVSDISITPLAIPMIAGPGAITNAIVLMNDAKDPVMVAIVTGTILLTIALTWLILRQSEAIIRFLGETGNTVLMRIMGLIVMVIAVEFFIAGATPIIREILRGV